MDSGRTIVNGDSLNCITTELAFWEQYDLLDYKTTYLCVPFIHNGPATHSKSTFCNEGQFKPRLWPNDRHAWQSFPSCGIKEFQVRERDESHDDADVAGRKWVGE